LRSVYLQKDKSIFKIDELPLERYAESLGLPGAPKIKFLSKEAIRRRKNASRTVEEAQAEVREEKESLKSARKTVVSKNKESEGEDDSGESSGESDGEGTSSSEGGEKVPAAQGKIKQVRFHSFLKDELLMLR
jgi:ATP-dependent RNA helicase DDX10/DBP4